MKRIFLVGVPRSGTTYLQSLLGCSPDLATFTESHFFSRGLTDRLGRPLVRRSPRALVEAFYRENGLDDPPQPRGPLLTARAAGRYFIRALDEAAAQRVRGAFLEKTPDHLRYIDAIADASPNPVHFVHIVREPGATCRSMVEASRQWGKPVTPEQALRKWHAGVRISLARASRHHFHHIVLFERLAEDPSLVLRLAERLRVKLSAQDLERRSGVLASITAPGEVWKADRTGRAAGLPACASDLFARLSAVAV